VLFLIADVKCTSCLGSGHQICCKKKSVKAGPYRLLSLYFTVFFTLNISTIEFMKIDRVFD
jgi:hypothetical protein